MSIRHNQIRFVLLIGLFVALVATAATPTPPPPLGAPPPLACETISVVHLGEGGVISCTRFTPNGAVEVIFYRSDGTISEHIGRADTYGNFDSTFTVTPDRPLGQWRVALTDVPSGQKIEKHFTVVPPLEAIPIPRVPDLPSPTATPAVPAIVPPVAPIPAPPATSEPPPPLLIALGIAAVAAAVTFLVFRWFWPWFWRSRPERRTGPLPEGGPEGPGAGLPAQGPCGFSSKEEKKEFGAWRFGGSMAAKITEPGKPPHTHVIWVRDVWLETEEYGPCPLPIGHPGDHQPMRSERILQGTEKLTVHYDAFITGKEAQGLVPSADGQPSADPEPVDVEHQRTEQ